MRRGGRAELINSAEGERSLFTLEAFCDSFQESESDTKERWEEKERKSVTETQLS